MAETIPVSIHCHDGTTHWYPAEYVGMENLTRHYVAVVRDTLPPIKTVRSAPLPMFTDVRVIAPGQVALVHESLLADGTRHYG